MFCPINKINEQLACANNQENITETNKKKMEWTVNYTLLPCRNLNSKTLICVTSAVILLFFRVYKFIPAYEISLFK